MEAQTALAALGCDNSRSSRGHDLTVLTAKVLEGYGADGVDRDAPAGAMWLAGCLNANSVLHRLHALADARSVVMAGLRDRADALATLVT